MDTIEQFIKKLEAEIEEIEPGPLQPNTEFRKLESWSSMHALIVLAFIDTEYGITFVGEDMRNCRTMQDIYDIILTKVN